MTPTKASQATLINLELLEKAAKTAGSKLYDRVNMAKQVFEDKGWVFEYHEGKDKKALKALGEQYLSDICCTLPLATLFAIFETFPQKQQWKDRDYNLQTLYAEWKLLRKDEKTVRERQSFTIKEKKELEHQLAEKDQLLVQLRNQLDEAVKKAALAEKKATELDRKIAFLEGKLSQKVA